MDGKFHIHGKPGCIRQTLVVRSGVAADACICIVRPSATMICLDVFFTGYFHGLNEPGLEKRCF